MLRFNYSYLDVLMLSNLKGITGNINKTVDRVYAKAVKKTGAVVDGETASLLKVKTLEAVSTASAIGRNIGDLNGDGKIDVEDLKVAAERAGIVWEKIDPDLKTALAAGGLAGIGVNVIPLVGQTIAVPTFAVTTAYVFLIAKLTGFKKK